MLAWSTRTPGTRADEVGLHRRRWVLRPLGLRVDLAQDVDRQPS